MWHKGGACPINSALVPTYPVPP